MYTIYALYSYTPFCYQIGPDYKTNNIGLDGYVYNSHCAGTDYPTSIECSVGGWYYYNSSINASYGDPTLKIECIRKSWK